MEDVAVRRSLGVALLAVTMTAAPVPAAAQGGVVCGCPAAPGKRSARGAGLLGLAGIGLLGIGVGEVMPLAVAPVALTPVLVRLGSAAPGLLPAFAPVVPAPPVTAFSEGALAPATASPLPLALLLGAVSLGAGWVARRRVRQGG